MWSIQNEYIFQSNRTFPSGNGVCFSNVVFSTQNIAVVVGEKILANENSVLSSMAEKSQSVDQSRTRKRKIHDQVIRRMPASIPVNHAGPTG